MIDLAPAANVWAARHPRVVEATTRLEQGGVTSALFASALHEIVSIELGVPLVRQPDDADLLILHGQFDAAADVLGAVTQRKRVSFQTRDGRTAYMIADEGLARIGHDDVQFMDPQTPLHVGTNQYDTAYTPHAASSRTVVETDYGLLPLAHPTDAVAVYAMSQRPHPKNDIYNASVLLQTGSLSDAYTVERAGDMGWDRRVWNFVWAASAIALQGVNQQIDPLQLPLPRTPQVS